MEGGLHTILRKHLGTSGEAREVVYLQWKTADAAKYHETTPIPTQATTKNAGRHIVSQRLFSHTTQILIIRITREELDENQPKKSVLTHTFSNANADDEYDYGHMMGPVND